MGFGKVLIDKTRSTFLRKSCFHRNGRRNQACGYDPSLFSPRFHESSLEELRDWSTLLEGEPSRASRIPSRPPRRMYTVESRLSRWLLLLLLL